MWSEALLLASLNCYELERDSLYNTVEHLLRDNQTSSSAWCRNEDIHL
jgi:hypothetical protein